MTDRIDHGAHDMPWVGTTVTTGHEVPGAGSWGVIEHANCHGNGMLRSPSPGSAAPACPVCGQPVAWELLHLASTVAADHQRIRGQP